MKRYTLIFLVGILFAAYSSKGQSGIITTIAGTGTGGYSGDGGAATAAMVYNPVGAATDASGNIYFADQNNGRVRKISSGVITTFAGDGSFMCGGDGGPAVIANFNSPWGISVNPSGDVYVADLSNSCIRKINTSGIITTSAGICGVTGIPTSGVPATSVVFVDVWDVSTDIFGNYYLSTDGGSSIHKVDPTGISTLFAGNASLYGYSGDGGPATAALLDIPVGLATDAAGNVYIADRNNNRIRKVNASGIISTIAGTGAPGYDGDGGPATAAKLYWPTFITLDLVGNIYISDGNSVIRKINTSGIISTIAGTGVAGYNGDGIAAVSAHLNGPSGLVVDPNGDLIVCDANNNRIRKITLSPAFVSDSFSVSVDNNCSGVDFLVISHSYSTGMAIRTFFGDGTTTTTPLLSGTSGGYATISHVYNYSGMYTVKQILMNGTTPLDTLSYSFQYKLCNTLPVKFYYDIDANCSYNSTADYPVFQPLTIGIDSNGVTIDTITTSGGFYYKAYGAAGDIYKFKTLATPPGFVSACPVTGIISDTLRPSSYGHPAKYLGFNCSSTPGFDLAVVPTLRAVSNGCMGEIVVWNKYCTPQPSTVTLYMTPKYIYESSNITPTTVAGNIITWDVAGLSSEMNDTKYIHFTMKRPIGSSPYLPGDTANSVHVISPIPGDAYSSDNTISRTDIIRSSYDPNYIEVSPDGLITAGTELTYTVGFENTGNDTAHNIYVMDTLSSNLDMSTFQVVAASADMSISVQKYGAYPVVKFDFPNIMLPDSSHHDLCHGLFVFKVKTKTGLISGTIIPNQVGIYFDENPVVMTNTVTNTIAYPTNVISVKNELAVSIYPNPANDALTINADNSIYPSSIITNTMGQQLLQQPLYASQTTVDVKMLPPGLYYITLRGEQGSVVRKFVKL